MIRQRKIYTTRAEKVQDFVFGVVIWHVVNLVLSVGTFAFSALLTQATTDGNSTVQDVVSGLVAIGQCLPFIINIAGLIYFGITRRWIALGALATIGFYLVLALCAAVVFATICFVSLSGTSN